MSISLPFLAVACAIVIIIAVASFLRNYIRVAPNEAAILYGWKRTITYSALEDDGAGGQRQVQKTKKVGYRIIKSGSAFKLPYLEKVAYMPLNVMTLPVSVSNVYSKHGVPVTIDAIANVKVKGDDISVEAAAERFLQANPNLLLSEMKKTIEETLQGHLRAIIGKMTPEELYSDRDAFSQNVQSAAGTELEAMGITIDNLPIKEVTDAHGYLDALGRGKIAEVLKTAEIAEAEAKRDSQKKTSDAVKEAEEVKAANDVLVAEAKKKRDIQIATFDAEVHRERAVAERAHDIALAAEEEKLKVAMAKRDAAEKKAQIEVEKEESARVEASLNATIVKKAEAEAKKVEIDAAVAKKKAIIEAEAVAESQLKKGKAQKEYDTFIGEGEAARERAILIAKAEGLAAEVKEKLLAEAAGKKADAEATKEQAAAYKELDERGQLLLILNALPGLIKEGGEAGEKIASAIFSSVAAPLGNIDSLHILDMGGNGNGSSGVNKVTNIVPDMVAKVFASLRTIGVDPSGIFEKLGLNMSDISRVLGPLVSPNDQPGKGSTGSGKKVTVDA